MFLLLYPIAHVQLFLSQSNRCAAFIVFVCACLAVQVNVYSDHIDEEEGPRGLVFMPWERIHLQRSKAAPIFAEENRINNNRIVRYAAKCQNPILCIDEVAALDTFSSEFAKVGRSLKALMIAAHSASVENRQTLQIGLPEDKVSSQFHVQTEDLINAFNKVDFENFKGTIICEMCSSSRYFAPDLSKKLAQQGFHGIPVMGFTSDYLGQYDSSELIFSQGGSLSEAYYDMPLLGLAIFQFDPKYPLDKYVVKDSCQISKCDAFRISTYVPSRYASQTFIDGHLVIDEIQKTSLHSHYRFVFNRKDYDAKYFFATALLLQVSAVLFFALNYQYSWN